MQKKTKWVEKVKEDQARIPKQDTETSGQQNESLTCYREFEGLLSMLWKKFIGEPL